MGPVELSGRIVLNRAAGAEPLSAQIYAALRSLARDGLILPDEVLPATRPAAQALGVSRNTLCAAYDLLAAEGVLQLRPGAAPRLTALSPIPPSPQAPAPRLSRRGQALSEDSRDGQGRGGWLTPGEPDPALFPADAWARALRRAGRQAHGDAAQYGQYHGLDRLRQALADQMLRHRGLRVSPERILVVPGTQAALALAAQVLADPGDTALIEDPGYNGARMALAAAGMHLAALPLGPDGPAWPTAGPAPRLVYLTPSTQFPTGQRLSLPHRQHLMQRASESGATVLEDDYDSEFLWRGQDIPPMAALGGPAPVLTLGTVSKSLLPGLRLGWILAPEALVTPLRQAQRALGVVAGLHAQVALAEFLESGLYRAHLRRIARVYQERGQGLVGELHTTLARTGWPGRVALPDGGLQVMLEYTGSARFEDRALARALNRRGWGVSPLSAYTRQSPRRGLVIGLAQATPARSRAFGAALGAALHAGTAAG